MKIACSWQVSPRQEPIRPRNCHIFRAATNRIGHQATAAHIPSDPILVRRALPGAYFSCRHQGGRHAEWPKDSHEHAPTQTCWVIFCPSKAVDTKCRPNPVERASKRPKKQRAISGASPGGSPGGECRRRGELLPTRRTLLQIDVPGPRRDVVGAVTTSNLASQAHLPNEFGVGCWHACDHDGADISLCGATCRAASSQFTFRRCRPILHGISDLGRACSASQVDKNRTQAWVACAKYVPSCAGYRKSNPQAKLF